MESGMGACGRLRARAGQVKSECQNTLSMRLTASVTRAANWARAAPLGALNKAAGLAALHFGDSHQGRRQAARKLNVKPGVHLPVNYVVLDEALASQELMGAQARHHR
jgi:hypothetical protein